MRRLICKYPAHKQVDRVLENLGEDFYHDEIHDLDAEDDEADKLDADARDSKCETAVAAEGGGVAADTEDESDASSDGDGVTAVAAICDGLATDAIDETAVAADCEQVVALNGPQAEAVHQNTVQIATLQGAIEAIQYSGQLKLCSNLKER